MYDLILILFILIIGIMFGKLSLFRWTKLDSFIPRLFSTACNETMPNQFVEQKFDYFLILDFEVIIFIYSLNIFY